MTSPSSGTGLWLGVGADGHGPNGRRVVRRRLLGRPVAVTRLRQQVALERGSTHRTTAGGPGDGAAARPYTVSADQSSKHRQRRPSDQRTTTNSTKSTIMAATAGSVIATMGACSLPSYRRTPQKRTFLCSMFSCFNVATIRVGPVGLCLYGVYFFSDAATVFRIYLDGK
jgi:hypothetical protein